MRGQLKGSNECGQWALRLRVRYLAADRESTLPCRICRLWRGSRITYCPRAVCCSRMNEDRAVMPYSYPSHRIISGFLFAASPPRNNTAEWAERTKRFRPGAEPYSTLRVAAGLRLLQCYVDVVLSWNSACERSMALELYKQPTNELRCVSHMAGTAACRGSNLLEDATENLPKVADRAGRIVRTTSTDCPCHSRAASAQCRKTSGAESDWRAAAEGCSRLVVHFLSVSALPAASNRA